MSGENTRSADNRQKRVRRLKKYIVLMLLLIILVPSMLCVFLLFRLYGMSRDLDELAGRAELLADETENQQNILQLLLENILTTGHGSQEQNVAGRELESYELGFSDETPNAAQVENTQGENNPEGQAGEGTDDAGAEVTVTHKVYLTFDDGPSANTEKILDILDQYGVKATFFVVGKEGDWAEEALKDIVARGHSLGMHSYTHQYTNIYDSVEAFAEDFVKLREYLEDVTGVTSDIYRFPGGSSNKISDRDMNEFAEYLDSWNVRFFDWNVSSGDGDRRLLTVNELVKNSLEGIGNRETSIILMHDAASKPTTVEALPKIIEGILDMENTEILPITEDTVLVQHINRDSNN